MHARCVQAWVRGFLARRELQRLRMMGTAVSVLQGAWRALQVRREFADWRRCVVGCVCTCHVYTCV